MSTYDIVQTVEQLNFAANGASLISATQSELQAFLKAYLTGGTTPINTQFAGFFPLMNPKLAGGDWQVVWGPIVYSVKPEQNNPATNAMYVAYSAALATYVVAIAATNATSMYDWVREDGDVIPSGMSIWPLQLPYKRPIRIEPPDQSQPCISAATALGVSLLLGMSDTEHGSLQSYLQKMATPDATLIFTGHSLAGALSPTLALALYGDPQNSGWKNIYVLPTAGASPGNARFAETFNAAYPATREPSVNAPYGWWNVDLANACDLVPHAWDRLNQVVTGMDGLKVDTIFGTMSFLFGGTFAGFIETGKGLCGGYTNGKANYYQHINQNQFQPEWGTWQNQWDDVSHSWDYPATWVSLPSYTPDNPMNSKDELGPVFLATHISQYIRFFQMEPPPKMAIKQPGTAQQAQDAHQMAMTLAQHLS